MYFIILYLWGNRTASVTCNEYPSYNKTTNSWLFGDMHINNDELISFEVHS